MAEFAHTTKHKVKSLPIALHWPPAHTRALASLLAGHAWADSCCGCSLSMRSPPLDHILKVQRRRECSCSDRLQRGQDLDCSWPSPLARHWMPYRRSARTRVVADGVTSLGGGEPTRSHVLAHQLPLACAPDLLYLGRAIQAVFKAKGWC